MNIPVAMLLLLPSLGGASLLGAIGIFGAFLGSQNFLATSFCLIARVLSTN